MNANTPTMTWAEFVDALGIRIASRRVTPTKARADKWADPNARHFTVTLKRGKLGEDYAEMRTPFTQGSAWTEDPTPEDVLDCLASDAAGVDNAQGFSDWCAEYGLDDDSRAAERDYNDCKRLRDRLKAFLGDHYDAALYSVERL